MTPQLGIGMFGKKQKVIERQESVIRNQDNLINNLNKNVTRHQEEAERLRTRNHELTELSLKKDAVIDTIEQREKARLEKMAFMLECMGFDKEKILKFVEDDANAIWTKRSFKLLAGYPGNKVKDFVNEPLDDLLSKIDQQVVAELPGSSDENKKEVLRQLGFLVMVINGVAAKDSWKEKKQASGE